MSNRFRKRDDPFPYLPPSGAGYFMFGIFIVLVFATGFLAYVSAYQ